MKLLNIEILVSHPGMNQGIPSKGKISRSWSNSRSSVSGTSICNMVYTIARQYTWLSPSLGPDRHPENRESASHMLRYWDKSFVSSLVMQLHVVGGVTPILVEVGVKTVARWSRASDMSSYHQLFSFYLIYFHYSYLSFLSQPHFLLSYRHSFELIHQFNSLVSQCLYIYR